MATHLNLEEQEQIAQLKGFWEEYGRTIIFIVVVLVAVIGGWAGWNYWQNKKASEASALYDVFNQSFMIQEPLGTQKMALTLQTEYGSTSYASLASLNAATVLYHANDLDSARAMLQWVKDNTKDDGWKALAVLRLADILTDQQKYDEALSVLTTTVPTAFVPYIADKRGNVYVAQGNTEDAKNAFMQAYQQMNAQDDLKNLVAAKLGLLGVNVLAIESVGEQLS